MIKVDRSKEPCPKTLLKTGVTERDNNVAIVQNDLNGELTFRAYKAKDVQAALQRLFHKKCAYCESYFASVTAADIEHFRPKGKSFPNGVVKSGFIGYYWLASEWNNLLLSCPGCNRPMQAEIFGVGKIITMGKHDQFPLRDEKYRCLKHGDVAALQREEKYRLLIHPCQEDPEEYFEYVIKDAGKGGIKAKGGLRGIKAERAGKSIEVYALYRIELAKERARHLDDLQNRILGIQHAMITYTKAITDLDKKFQMDFINNQILLLLKFEEPDQKFSAMSKQLIGEFLATLSPELKEMVGRK